MFTAMIAHNRLAHNWLSLLNYPNHALPPLEMPAPIGSLSPQDDRRCSPAAPDVAIRRCCALCSGQGRRIYNNGAQF